DITRAGEHLLALINDILDLSKVEAGKMDVQPDAFSLQSAVQTLASTLRPVAESKQVALKLGPPGQDGEIRTDPAPFRPVLYNLLSNAIRFTNSGGRVAILWEWLADAKADSCVVADPSEAKAFRLAVVDTGIGISPEDQPMIWDEFRQVKVCAGEQQQQGTG